MLYLSFYMIKHYIAHILEVFLGMFLKLINKAPYLKSFLIPHCEVFIR